MSYLFNFSLYKVYLFCCDVSLLLVVMCSLIFKDLNYSANLLNGGYNDDGSYGQKINI